MTEAQFQRKLARALEPGDPLRFPPGFPEAEKARYEAERESLQATRDRQLKAAALLEEPERGFMFVDAQQDYDDGVAELMFEGLEPQEITAHEESVAAIREASAKLARKVEELRRLREFCIAKFGAAPEVPAELAELLEGSGRG